MIKNIIIVKENNKNNKLQLVKTKTIIKEVIKISNKVNKLSLPVKNIKRKSQEQVNFLVASLIKICE